MPSFPHQQRTALPLPAVAQASAHRDPGSHATATHEQVERIYKDKIESTRPRSKEGEGKPGSKEKAAEPPSQSHSNPMKLSALPLPAFAQVSAHRDPGSHAEQVERMYRDKIQEVRSRSKEVQSSKEGAGKAGSTEKAAEPSLMASETPSHSNPMTMTAFVQASTHQGPRSLVIETQDEEENRPHSKQTNNSMESWKKDNSMESGMRSPDSKRGHRSASKESFIAFQKMASQVTYNSQVDEVFDQLRKNTSNTLGHAEDDKHPGKASGWSRALQLVVYMAILVSSVQLGVQIDYPENDEFYYWSEITCNGIFVVEMVAKLVHSRSKYFQSGWNIFDFSLVMIAAVDFTLNQMTGGSGSAANLPGLRALRMFRAVRVLRVLKMFKELWLIVRGIVMSLRAMFWVILLLLMILYMCGIFCTIVMEDAGPIYPGYSAIDEIPGGENMEYFNPNEMFGTIPRSMYTLFQLALLTEFSQFGRPIFEKQPEFFPFFIFFIFLVTFGVLNVLIAVIVEVTMEASAQLKDEEGDRKMKDKLALLDQLQQVVFKMDEDSTGSISVQQFEHGFEDEDMQKLLVNMGFPVGFTAAELWTLLDADGNGMLEVEEFVRAAFRMVTCSQEPFQFQCVLMSNLSHLQHTVNSVKQEMQLNSQPATTCEITKQLEQINKKLEKTATPKATIVASRYRSRRQRSRCYIKMHRKPRSRNCHQDDLHAPSACGPAKDAVESSNDRVPEVKTKPADAVCTEQLEQLLANRGHGPDMLPREMPPTEIKSLLHDSIPEVETKPANAVCAKQLEQLLANRVHGLLPSEMSPKEIKSLLEWRKDDTGQLKYKELEDSVACMAACLDNTEVFKCFMLGMLSSIRETQRQASDTHHVVRVCHTLLQNASESI